MGHEEEVAQGADVPLARFEPPPSYAPPQVPYGTQLPSQPQVVMPPGQPQPAYYGQQPLPQQQQAGMGGLPIIVQPGAPQPEVRWIAVPKEAIPDCPPGLEFLAGLEKIVIRQKQELIEIVTAIEIPNRYSIETPNGEQVYYAVEDPDYVQAQAMGNNRGYRIKVYDGYNRVAFSLVRPLKYCSCGCCGCFDCCKREGTTEGAGGAKLGGVRTRRACCSSALTLTDEHDKDIVTIDGPCCCSRCCSDAEFPLKSAKNGAHLGKITRKYFNYIQSTYSKADVFELEFPADMSVRLKANIIGACIMVDFLEFEYNNNQNRQQRR